MVTDTVGSEAVKSGPVGASRAARVAWLLPLGLGLGAYLGRGSLGSHGVLFTIINVLVGSFLVLTMRNMAKRAAWLWAVVIVLFDGGFLQLFWLSYKLHADPVYLQVYTPYLGWIRASDIDLAYRELTLLFAALAGFAWVATRFSLGGRFPRTAQLARSGHLKRWIVGAAVGYAVATLLQVALGFGLYGTATAAALPFHLTTVLSFYRQQFFPAVLILAAWCFDRETQRWWFRRAVAALGVVAIVEAYISTSRGTIINYGLPLLFLWILTGRMTKSRKSIVVVAMLAYLVLTPVLTSLRSERLFASHAITQLGLRQDSGFTIGGLTQGLQQTIIRVGGAQGVLIAEGHSHPLGLSGLPSVFAPNGLITYYTYDVVGLRRGTALVDLRSPSGAGAAILVGGPKGAVLVLLLVLALFAVCWAGEVRLCRSWPVGCALLCAAAVNYFSEGNMVILYKALLAAAIVEWIYRRHSVALDQRAREELVVAGGLTVPAATPQWPGQSAL